MEGHGRQDGRQEERQLPLGTYKLDLKVCISASGMHNVSATAQAHQQHHGHVDLGSPAIYPGGSTVQEPIMYKSAVSKDCCCMGHLPTGMMPVTQSYESQGGLELKDLMQTASANQAVPVDYPRPGLMPSQPPIAGSVDFPPAIAFDTVHRARDQGYRRTVLPQHQPWGIPGEAYTGMAPCQPLAIQVPMQASKPYSRLPVGDAEKAQLEAHMPHPTTHVMGNPWASQFELRPRPGAPVLYNREFFRAEARRCDRPPQLGLAPPDWHQTPAAAHGGVVCHRSLLAPLPRPVDILDDILSAPQHAPKVLYRHPHIMASAEYDDYDYYTAVPHHLQRDPLGPAHDFRRSDERSFDARAEENRLKSDANRLAHRMFDFLDPMLYCHEDALSGSLELPDSPGRHLTLNAQTRLSRECTDSTSWTRCGGNFVGNLACTERLEFTTSPAAAPATRGDAYAMSRSQRWFESEGAYAEQKRKAWMQATHKEMQSANAYLVQAQLPGLTPGTHVKYTPVTREMELYEIGLKWRFSGSAICLAHLYLLRLGIKALDLVAMCVCLFLASQVCDPVCITNLVQMLQRIKKRSVDIKEARDLQFEFLMRLDFRLGPYFQVGWNDSSDDLMTCG